ncbi:MAG: Gldg family protein [Desulfobacter sp.]|nr:Gldg family protein [Desulfobacter sp.]WDP85499.1 MAG: Gldg family protein [Desulfobacter sp.]
MGKPFLKDYYIKFILYLAVIVLVNLAGLTLFFRADLTQNRMYSLSDASIQAVSTLSEPLNIKVFFSKNLPAPHNNTERYLKDLLSEYAAQAGRFFNFTFYNVSQEGDIAHKADQNRDMARDYGIQPVQIRVMENDELKFKNAYMGLVILHGDLIEKIPAITSSNGLEYQLTTAIQKLNNKVSALVRQTEKIKVTMYLSSDLNPIAPLIGLPELPGLGSAVTRTIEQMNKKSLGIFDFTRLDPKDSQELEKTAKKYDLMAMSWPAIPEKSISAGTGIAGLVVEYKGEAKDLPLISAMELPIIGTTYQMADPQGLEEELFAVMEKMIGINKDVGYLSDHGTPTLGPDRMAMMQGRQGNGLNVFNQLLETRYNVKQVSLEKDTIPEGLNCLVIAKPTQPFSAYELFQIDQALMKGTNLAIFSDAFKEQAPARGMGMPPGFIPIDTGLEKLLAHYGLKIDPAYVMDKSAYTHQVPQSQGGGEQPIYFAPMLKDAGINNDPVFMKNIKGLVAMQISPLSLVDEFTDKERVKAVSLLQSSDQSWLMKENINLNPIFITPPEAKEDFSAYDLAYLLEGKFTSYFKGKPVPEKESGEKEILPEQDDNEKSPEKNQSSTALKEIKTQNRVIESSAPAKIFVLGCAQMLHDNMLDAEGRTTNATFLLNVVDHLNGEDKIAQMRSKQQTLNPLTETSALTKGVIKAFNIAGLPVLVVLFGLGVLVRRNLRKKKIAQMYTLGK